MRAPRQGIGVGIPLRDIQGRELAITEFDERLWLAVVDQVVVGRDGSMTFLFKNGSKVEA